MIGLGGNRLTVCRRGGMSVTQAGRGGMEWLGVRDPSWATPYSAQATAALKAQFPTQWPTIRDYGFAHPEIVPYVNEEPIVYGTMITLGYSPMVFVSFDGASWIDTGLASSNAQSYDCVLSNVAGRGATSANAIAGSSSHYANRILYMNTSKLQHQQRNSRNIEVPISDFDSTTLFTLVCGDNNDYFTVNGVAGTYASNGGNTTSGNFYIGVYAKTYNNNPGIFNAHKFNIYTGSTKVRQYYPVKRNSDGKYSLYDYLNNRFETNLGTGTIGGGYSLSESPA